ncbi:YniB family protein [Stutzerimonas nitrititolerans]|uniref:YniB family protein n=1 Tax=Stutzerimonas nitrititolerans TaxID=2482751 RepID=UPI00289AB53A|nr:YniB family protein [Stutzerimonas nitrititolerans]
MNIQQAIIRSRVQRTVGGVLLLGGTLFYFVSLLMALYHAAVAATHIPMLRPLGGSIQNLIASVYEATVPYIGFVWRNVPTINQADPFTYSNLMFLGLIGVMILGGQLRIAGKRLQVRINKQIEKVEDMQWRQSMMGGAAGGTSISADTIGHLNVYQQSMPPSSDEKWWTRPWGIIGLGIVSGYAVAVLAKMTGML